MYANVSARCATVSTQRNFYFRFLFYVFTLSLFSIAYHIRCSGGTRVSESFHTILLSGGTGSWGQAATSFLLENTSATIRIYSRSELLQAEMSERFKHNHRLRFLLGDIRDFARLQLAMDGVDLVMHGAALKHIDAGEYSPDEFVKTNVNGTQNVIHACIVSKVKKAIFLSSDKAVSSSSLYGNTKAIAEKLWTRANGYSPHGTSFVSLRYGNVANSRGSVIPKWENCLFNNLPLPTTNLSMSRFWISLSEAVRLAWFAAHYGPRGTILVPYLPAYTMADLLKAFCEEHGIADAIVEDIGVRPGEKHHEMLLTDDESSRVITYTEDGIMPKYYCIQSASPSWEMVPWQQWPPEPGSQWQLWTCMERYSSDTWRYRLTVPELRERLQEGK